MLQCSIYCLAMLWEMILLLVDLVCGMWVGTLQNEKTTTTCCRLLLGSCVMKRYNHSQYIRDLHWNFDMDIGYIGYVTNPEKKGIWEARGFMFHKEEKINSPLQVAHLLWVSSTYIYKTCTCIIHIHLTVVTLSIHFIVIFSEFLRWRVQKTLSNNSL